MQDIRRFHQAFYSTSRKVVQDSFPLKYTVQNKPARTSRAKIAGSSRKTTSNSYFIPTKKGPVQVCAKSFLTILGVSKYRVQILCRTHLTTGLPPKENRGGDRRSKFNENRKKLVTEFLKKLEPVESHYTRDKSTRLYLPCELNLKKLWRMYNENTDKAENKVKYSFFRNIFNFDFNMSFKTPTTDACSTCIQLQSQIKISTNATQKNYLIMRLRVHKLRASAFYSILKNQNEDNQLVLSFDCQKNLVLPKVPDQSAYYSRQLYQYNLTVVKGHSKAKQNKENVTVYAWLENEHYKSSNEICSAIWDSLNCVDLEGKTTILLCADGCPGQNKNTMIIAMVAKWFQEIAPATIEEVIVMYPVVGHSFLPPDRVFGRIEKVIRKRETIITPSEYLDIFSDFATVKRLGSEVPVKDWKTAVQSVIKRPASWHFRFSQAKRFILKKSEKRKVVLVQGEVHYRSNIGTSQSIMKVGKKLCNIVPRALENKVPVNLAKLKDVDKLLKSHFGDDWRLNPELNYYKMVIDDNEGNTPGVDQPPENENDGINNIDEVDDLVV